MRFPLLNASIAVFLSSGLPTTIMFAYGEAHCPENVASVTPRMIAGALLVIPVKVNQSGPFDFMVDSGSQITVVDPSLAFQLNLKGQGTVGLVATASYIQASAAELDSLEVGSHVVDKPLVVVQDLGPIQAADPRIRGVLGENFLGHFDLLIDYPRKLLCLDDAQVIEGTIHGEHIPLMAPEYPEDQLRFTDRLVISAHLSDTGNQEIFLQLDSGSDGPILFAGNKKLEEPLLKHATLREGNASQAQRAFALLPSQELRIGHHTVSNVHFVTPVSAAQNIPHRDEDGVLPTVLFQRVFISSAKHYAVFDPR